MCSKRRSPTTGEDESLRPIPNRPTPIRKRTDGRQTLGAEGVTVTDRPAATGVPGAADSARPDQTPGSQLQAPATAVLDEAHVGDIQGAFGTVKQQDTERRRSWGKRLLVCSPSWVPGLIVMVGDNDAGGVSTYAQAGQDFGLSLCGRCPCSFPVLIVNQEMVVRLGAVTGVGHARLINRAVRQVLGGVLGR
jgi:hypothetical protein